MLRFDLSPRLWMLSFVLGGTMLASPCIVAQQDAATALSFEVATIKPGSQGLIIAPSGSPENFAAAGVTVETLIGYAYDIPWMQSLSNKREPPFHPRSPNLLGGPEWVRSEIFDVSAKADEATVAAWRKLPPDQQKEQMRLMVRALLAGRFRLKIRHATEVIPVYALIVTKDGPKFKPTASEPATSNDANAPAKPYQSPWKFGEGMIEGHGVTIDGLIPWLWAQPEVGSRKNIDRTGLKGQYDITLKWASQRDPSEEAAGPSLFSALEDQLGLKLESTKAPVDVLVIDSIEKPTPN
jgi:uncharacterized protein (TIGR03435 family)